MAKRALCLIIYFSLFSISACSNNIDKAESFIKVKMYDKAEALLKTETSNIDAQLLLARIYLLQDRQITAKDNFANAWRLDQNCSGLRFDESCQNQLLDQYFAAIDQLIIEDQKNLASKYLQYIWDNYAQQWENREALQLAVQKRQNHGLFLIRQITSKYWDINPTWHPSGTFLIFQRGDRSDGSLDWRAYRINYLTKEIFPFVNPFLLYQNGQLYVDWSMNGKNIIFTLEGIGEHSTDKKVFEDIEIKNIWHFNFESENQRIYSITNERERSLHHPCFTNNDQNIVFQKEDAEIWIMEANGENPHQIVKGSVPSCPPKGKWLIYKSHDNEHVASDILAFNLETSESIQLTDNEKTTGADLSPDEKRLVFIEIIRPEENDMKTGKLIQQGKYKIIIADFPSMQNQSIVFQADGHYGCIPRWSPNGKHIVFCHGPEWSKNSIWLIDL